MDDDLDSTLDAAARLQELRQKVLNDEDVSVEEYTLVIDSIRETRRSAATKKTKNSKEVAEAAAKLPTNISDLFSTDVEEQS